MTVSTWFASRAGALTVGVATGPNAAGVTRFADVATATGAGEAEALEGVGAELVPDVPTDAAELVGAVGAEPPAAPGPGLGVRSATAACRPEDDDELSGRALGAEGDSALDETLETGDEEEGLEAGATVTVTETIVTWAPPAEASPGPVCAPRKLEEPTGVSRDGPSMTTARPSIHQSA